MKTFANKVALVSGGTSGICAATAFALPNKSAKVAGSGRAFQNRLQKHDAEMDYGNRSNAPPA